MTRETKYFYPCPGMEKSSTPTRSLPRQARELSPYSRPTPPRRSQTPSPARNHQVLSAAVLIIYLLATVMIACPYMHVMVICPTCYPVNPQTPRIASEFDSPVLLVASPVPPPVPAGSGGASPEQDNSLAPASPQPGGRQGLILPPGPWTCHPPGVAVPRAGGGPTHLLPTGGGGKGGGAGGEGAAGHVGLLPPLPTQIINSCEVLVTSPPRLAARLAGAGSGLELAMEAADCLLNKSLLNKSLLNKSLLN